MPDTPGSRPQPPAHHVPRRVAGALGVLAVLLLVLAAGACRSLLPLRVPAMPEVRFNSAAPGDVPARTIVGPSGAGLTLVRGTIDGRDSGWLLLDSGSSNLLVSRRAARALRLPAAGEGYAGRDLRVTYYLADSFQLGPLVLEKALVAGADLDRLAALRQALGVDLAGLAGYQVFAQAVVEIQYGAGGPPEGGDRVLLHDPRAYHLPRGTWLPLRIIDRRPAVVAQVVPRTSGSGGPGEPGTPNGQDEPSGDADGAAPLRALFLVDTGTAGGLILDQSFAREAGLTTSPPAGTAEQITLAGSVPAGTTRVPRLTLDQHHFDDLPATVRTDLFEGRQALAAVDGILGRNLLRHFTVVFDVAHERIALLPPAQATGSPPNPSIPFGHPHGAGVETR